MFNDWLESVCFTQAPLSHPPPPPPGPQAPRAVSPRRPGRHQIKQVAHIEVKLKPREQAAKCAFFLFILPRTKKKRIEDNRHIVCNSKGVSTHSLPLGGPCQPDWIETDVERVCVRERDAQLIVYLKINRKNHKKELPGKKSI